MVSWLCVQNIAAGDLVHMVCLMEARKLQVVNHLEMRMDGFNVIVSAISCIMCADDAG